jgi:hypothetical protein
MRKVSNETNINALDILSNTFIRPLLQAILHSKIDSVALDKTTYFAGLGTFEKNVLQVSLKETVVSRKNKKNGNSGVPAVKLHEYCDQIIAIKKKEDIEKTIKQFDYQRSKIAAGNYNVKPEKIDAMFKVLFVEYLYTKLFDNKNIWGALGLEVLSRKIFHKNFKKDNAKVFVCPYCDLDTIISNGSHEVEHFLPKSIFPLLSLDPRNLFSACIACNKSSGKGGKVVKSVTSPYCLEIGSKVNFKFKNTEEKIEIYASAADPEIQGYLDLVNLIDRYGDSEVWSVFNARKEAFSESFQNRKLPNLANALLYADRFQVAVPLTYALKFWIRGTGIFLQ